MISKKRYLELKKRRKQLHKRLKITKMSYIEAKSRLDHVRNYLTIKAFDYRQEEYIKLKTEYNLISELIDSTKHIMKTDMVFRVCNLVNKKLYYRLKHEM